MDIAKFSIEKKVITWLTIAIFTLGGLYAFNHLGRLEDPEFTIKTAMVFTAYPGATPLEVEEEVTDRVETAIQQLQYVDEIRSKSYPGISEITVDIKDKFKKADLPQIWDELRRKVNDVQHQLPPGAVASIVNDDFGDVFGIYYALTGDGYTYQELKEYGKRIRKELLLVNNVAKVQMNGVWDEQIFVEISNARLSQLGISPQTIYSALQAQNLVVPSGEVKVADEYIRIQPTGNFSSVAELQNLILSKIGSDKLILLKDVANVFRGYEEVPGQIIRFNGHSALTIGISVASGGNVVVLGKAISDKLESLTPTLPAGIELHQIYYQPKLVEQSVNGFVISLVQAILIVIVVLLLFMGPRVGVIIGAVLLLSILATFVFMQFFKIDLERISLGALVIALGMLVDNAIVVAEGILVRLQKGERAITAASAVIRQTKWPLLGATIIGILAFAPIGLSDDSTGEFCASLFYVLLISLLLSWYFAITATPLFCAQFLKVAPINDNQNKPSVLMRLYRKLLLSCLKFRWLTVLTMVILLGGAIYGFGFIKQSFFPNSMTPMFMVDFWREQGTDIRTTSAEMAEIEKYINSLQSVESVSTFVGKGASRFTLTYDPEQSNSSYGQFIIKVNSHQDIASTSKAVLEHINQQYPYVQAKNRFIQLGPGGGDKIEVRLLHENPVLLRQVSEKIKTIMHDTGEAIGVKDDWRQKVKVIEPIYSEAKSRNSGVNLMSLKNALQMSFSGMNVGIYRESDELIPIVVRPPNSERLNVSSLNNIQIWSPTRGQSVPIEQVISGVNTVWQDQLIHRQNRKRVITVSCDPAVMNTNDLFQQMRHNIENAVPPEVTLEWGGEYENSSDAQGALSKQLPKGALAILIILIILFNAFKQPIIIILTVPLAIIGVSAGLLATGAPFGFMPLLGLLSLAGMLIKNAIVLIDQTDYEIAEGKAPFLAVVDSAASRVRPVSLAAATTVLGMIPLLPDVFFSGMAITIMAGLSFATVLTLLFVPVLYAIIFRIPYVKNEAG